jgi:hypothetical protein
MIRPPRYGCPARTLRLRLLLVPQDETFSPGAISRPAPLPSVRGFFFARLAAPSPRRFPLQVLEKPGITARKGSG